MGRRLGAGGQKRAMGDQNEDGWVAGRSGLAACHDVWLVGRSPRVQLNILLAVADQKVGRWVGGGGGQVACRGKWMGAEWEDPARWVAGR